MIETLTKFASEEADSASGISALGVDGKAFIIQLLTFLLVFYVLYKFVFQRVVDVLEKRRKTIDEGVKLTTDLKSEREKLEKEVAEAHKKVRSDADKLLAEAKDQADEIVRNAEEDAQERATKMIEDARKKISDEAASAKRKLEGEIVSLVIEATEKVAGEKLDAKKDADLLDRALKGRA